MPVRSLSSPVLKWPNRETVLAAARAWATALRAQDAQVLRAGCFGSYARGDAGVGSDLDLVVIVREEAADRLFDVTHLPVPADVVVYAEPRWMELAGAQSGLARTIAREAIWLA